MSERGPTRMEAMLPVTLSAWGRLRHNVRRALRETRRAMAAKHM
mgnify:CR=1 FL=1